MQHGNYHVLYPLDHMLWMKVVDTCKITPVKCPDNIVSCQTRNVFFLSFFLSVFLSFFFFIQNIAKYWHIDTVETVVER